MVGPWRITYHDYFGFEHKVIVWANNYDEAIDIFKKSQEYYCEIIDVKLILAEWLLNSKRKTSIFEPW